MPVPTTRSRLAAVHRWCALALAPVIAVILVTGIILAFRPILGLTGDERPQGAILAPVRATALLDSLDQVRRIGFALVQDDRRSVTVFTSPNEPPKTFDVATGGEVATPPFTPPSFFDRVEQVHKDLWWGLGWLVSLAAVAMVILVIAGPILARPSRSRRTALGWHIWTGWVTWPLVALLPLSLVMMKLHAPVFGRRPDHPVAPVAMGALLREAAAGGVDLTRLDGIQRFPGGAIVVADGAHGPERFVVRDGAVRPLQSKVSALGEALHAGTWAGAWSGALNAVAALLLLVMMTTGIRSWWTRRRRAAA